MYFISSILVASAAFTSLVSAALCTTDQALPTTYKRTLPGEYTLWARNSQGSVLPVVSAQLPNAGGFFYPLYLGAADLSPADNSVPKFILSGGVAYSGGTIIASDQGLLLGPIPLYLASDMGQHLLIVASVNGTCGNEKENLLKFNNILSLPIGSSHLNSSFAPGVGLNTPAVTGLLGLAGENVDLIFREFDD